MSRSPTFGRNYITNPQPHTILKRTPTQASMDDLLVGFNVFGDERCGEMESYEMEMDMDITRTGDKSQVVIPALPPGAEKHTRK